ncbi:MAG TPA: hypothetical protein VH637_17160 [Streptosporangiaceae bacterium]|jgi:hypothetical protein
MIRRVIAVAAVAIGAGMLAPLGTTPALAGTGVGQGPNGSISVSISKYIRYGGSASRHGGNVQGPVETEIPPCLWVPLGDATKGSKAILSTFTSTDPSQPFNIGNSVKQAQDLLKNPKPGDWFELPVNPAAGEAGFQACLKLPLYVFVPPGGTPPIAPVPPRILAEYAFNHMIVPRPAVLTSPRANTASYVNLATFAWVRNVRQVRASASLDTIDGTETVWVTADPSASGANPNPVTISVNGPGTIADNCGESGSKYPVGSPPADGPGVPPDCGVLWTAPGTGAVITVQVNYHVTWGNADQGAPLHDIQMQGSSAPITVREIQSVNNG